MPRPASTSRCGAPAPLDSLGSSEEDQSKGIRQETEGDMGRRVSGHHLRRRLLRLTGCPLGSTQLQPEVPMLKRRFRLPSPALVISMITLSFVLGGTAVAASTAK